MRALKLPGRIRHGTTLAVQIGCRCDVCAAAIPHGTQTGYVNWACRCDDCRWAHYPHTPCRRCGSDAPRARGRRFCGPCAALKEVERASHPKVGTPEWRAKLGAGVRRANAAKKAANG